MNVIIFTHAAGSLEYGPNLRWYYLGRRLTDLGCNVTIVGSSFFHKYVTQPKVSGFYSIKSIDGIKYVFLKNFRYRSFWGRLINQLSFPLLALVWVIKNGKRLKPDIVVASSPPPFCIFAANCLAKKRKAALIYEVRDLWPMVVQELSGASSQHPYIRMLKRTERYAVENSDLVVSVKPGDFDYFKNEYQLENNRFAFLSNGFLPDNNENQNIPPPEPDEHRPIIVGYVGAMSAYYGLNELLGAAEQLKDDPTVRFVLVGGGEDYESLFGTKNEKKLENVEFLGRIPKKDVPKYLADFDICYVGLKDVTANLHGISCNKIFEYMYAGKPIVASYHTIFDPVQQAECGITVSPGSPSEIKSAILELKDSRVKREEMGVNARAYFDGNHDFNVIGEKYLEKMRELRSNG
jgi:glycosyltransferase involved in cell wall biosynthesis